MTKKIEHEVCGEDIYLPAPKQEVHTHISCPNCGMGEVVISDADTHKCDNLDCGEEFGLVIKEV